MRQAARHAAALLSVAEMAAADRYAVAHGIAAETLMERAGKAVADAVLARFQPVATAVLCGPGNNGGDGFVIARHLAEAGWPVTVVAVGTHARRYGEAAAMSERWRGSIVGLDPETLLRHGLIVDALFGAGLDRPLDGAVRQAIERLGASRLPVVAVDVPSGVHGDTGAVMGAALQAVLTVTFFRRKPGHLLMPGRRLCGEVVVADIGIPEEALEAIGPRTFANGPDLWLDDVPRPRLEGHKYDRGHALVVSGPVHRTGAARLAARAALRAGAGLVTLASPPDTVMVNAAQTTAVMIEPFEGQAGFERALADRRRNAVLIGPGAGIGAETRKLVLCALASSRSVVLDADALTSFESDPHELFESIRSPCLLTPHHGEFGRLFWFVDNDLDKLVRARAAATGSNACVLLKGPDTVIAAPDGTAAINENAPPNLATAGSGDVLAGIAVGLMAQGMDTFQAACAAVWLHGEAARDFGPGLIAEDLVERLPAALRAMNATTAPGQTPTNHRATPPEEP